MLVNTPPMGWNSWNTFGCNIDASLVRDCADKFVELGLDKAGYQYIVIDDCWSERDRDPKTGEIVADRKKFPDGMKAVSDYVHSKGLKFGMYSCAGIRTCADFPGSFDHEFLDAKTFASFGCDFLKYDFCFKPVTSNGPMLYRRMGNALRACGRDILFSACNWGSDDVWSWIRSAGAHMYRSTGDINDTPASFTSIVKSQLFKYCYSAPQCFNDIDMLTVGMYGAGNVRSVGGCDFTHYKLQFALWCMLGAPLMLGNDIRKMTPEILDLVTNKDLIAVNQDPEVRPAFIPGMEKPAENYADLQLVRMLANGDLAVGLFNLSDSPRSPWLSLEAMGFPAASGVELNFREIFTGETFTPKRELLREQLEPYGCRFYRVTPVLK